MSWTTRRNKLTKDQKERGVVYSFELVVLGHPEIDRHCHEVLETDECKYETIANLKDVSFFKKMARDFGWDVVNIVYE